MIPALIGKIIGKNTQKRQMTILKMRKKPKNPTLTLRFSKNFLKQSIALHFSGNLSKISPPQSPQNLPLRKDKLR